MQTIILLTWITQGILMFFDEFFFHQKRGLGKWESIGHPVDSFFFLIIFIFSLMFPSNQMNLNYFIALGIISTLMITKDEWIHTEQCDSIESWLHSLLFVIHPIAIGVLFIAWSNNLTELIYIQATIIFLFMMFQTLYWNIFRGNKYETKS